MHRGDLLYLGQSMLHIKDYIEPCVYLIRFNRHKILAEIDTRAAASILTWDTFQAITKHESVIQIKSNLISAEGERINTRGKVNIKVQLGNKIVDFCSHIVKIYANRACFN